MFLEKIRKYKDEHINGNLRRYWCFPTFKEVNDGD